MTMTLRRIILGGALAAAVLPVMTPQAAAQQTRLLTAEKHNEYGLVYSLPLTALRIEVEARHESRKAGPYWQYAKKYVGTDRAVTHDSESWTITRVTVTPYGVSDNSRQYLMQLKPGATTYIGVGDDGMLLSINRRPEPINTSPAAAPARNDVTADRIAPGEYLQYVNEDFIASQSSAKQASMLAETLMEIRDAKVSLTRGTADSMPKDGRQLELMLNSLAHQEAAMTSAFLGITDVETVTRTYTFLPDAEGNSVLFRLSDFAGFVDVDDYSGAAVRVNIRTTDPAQLPVDAKGETKKVPKDAVMYCIPGSAQVTLTLDDAILYDGELDFAQFGMEFGLNPILFTDKKSPSYAIFDPATGALKEIGVMREEDMP